MESSTDLLRSLMVFVRTANRLECIRYGPQPPEQIHNLITCHLVTIAPYLFFCDITEIIIRWRGHTELPPFDRPAISCDTRIIIASIMRTAGALALPDRPFDIHLPITNPEAMEAASLEIVRLTHENLALLLSPPPEPTLLLPMLP